MRGLSPRLPLARKLNDEKSDRNAVGVVLLIGWYLAIKFDSPGPAPEKEAAPDFVGVAKITAPGIGRSGRTRPATCKWPRLSSPSCIDGGVRLVPRLQGSLGKRGRP